MNLEFRQLEVFREVVRLGSFSRAAARLHMSQATVSERISQLEEDLGARLLDRSGRRGVRPTPVGHALYERAVRLLEGRELALQEVRDLLGVRRGTLVIGASTVPGTYHLPAAIRKFIELYPETRFTVSTAGSAQVIEWVSSGRVELGIAGDPREQRPTREHTSRRDTLRAEVMPWKDHLVLIAPPGHPLARKRRVSVADLAGVPFVMRESGSGTRSWVELYLAKALPGGLAALRVAVEIGSLAAVKTAVAHGLGVSLVSACAVEPEVTAGALRVVELDGPSLSRSFYMIQDQQRTQSPLSRLFAQVLLDDAAPAVDSGDAA